MRPPALSNAPLLLAILLAPSWLAACSPTATYGTGEAPEMALIREVTGGIMGGNKKDPIEYQPRAPLVMPPTAQGLPSPVETASAKSPDWPVGYDQSAPTVSVATHANRPPGSEDLLYGAGQAEYRRLKPLTGALPESQRSEPVDSRIASRDIGGKKQREQFRQALTEARGYNRERRFLTDPPTEYREPAATAPAEFEDIKGGGGWLGWLRRP